MILRILVVNTWEIMKRGSLLVILLHNRVEKGWDKNEIFEIFCKGRFDFMLSWIVDWCCKLNWQWYGMRNVISRRTDNPRIKRMAVAESDRVHWIVSRVIFRTSCRVGLSAEIMGTHPCRLRERRREDGSGAENYQKQHFRHWLKFTKTEFKL